MTDKVPCHGASGRRAQLNRQALMNHQQKIEAMRTHLAAEGLKEGG